MSNEAKPVQPKWLQVTDTGVTVTLRYPAVVHGTKLDSIHMRAPSVKDWRAANAAASGNTEDREMHLFSSLTEVGRADLEGLMLVDYNRLQTGYFRLVEDDEL